MIAREKLMKAIEGDFRWANIIGFINGNDDIEFMLRPYDICLEDENTLMVETDQITFKIRIPEDVTFNEDWETFEFSSGRVDYVFKFLNSAKER